jgi:hypothetical protein
MSTTGKGFRYPVYSDTPDVPRDLGYLAADVDAYLDAHPGPPGPQGDSGTISIGTITTVPSTTPAAVTNSGTSSNAIFNFTIPRGVDGIIGGPGPSNILTVGSVSSGNSGTLPVVTITGTSPSQTINFTIPKGDTGSAGPTGATGPKGDAAATISVGTTLTGNAGTSAQVTNSGTSSAVVLNFTIPKGADGAAGSQGPQGPAGADASLTNITTTISLATPTGNAAGNPGINSDWYPLIDNYKSIGAITNGTTIFENHRWKTIYSNTAAISTSDINSKKDITTTDLGLNFINSLSPVSYRFKVGENLVEKDENNNLIITAKPGTRKHYGLIAQQVKEVLDEANVEDFGGWVLIDKNNPDSEQALRYEEFISPLIKAVQELTARVKSLEDR